MAFQDSIGKTRRMLMFLLVACLCAHSLPRFAAGQSGASKVKGGYYVAGTTSLLPSRQINSSYFTHLFYAFVYLDPQNSNVVAPIDQIDEMQGFSSNVKSINSDVFTLISISANGTEFAEVLQSQTAKKAFIDSSIKLARDFEFDGLDLDWEFSQSQDEMTAFGNLLRDWRKAVVEEASQTGLAPLLLTAAAYFNPTFIFADPGVGTYPVSAMGENLDFVNIMSYDFHVGVNSNRTGANANLYSSSGADVLSVNYGISSWLTAGLPAEKAVLGLTLYGRSWTLANQALASGINAPTIAPGPEQSVSQQTGIFYYSEIPDWIDANNATVVSDTKLVTSYCYGNNLWISYEDPAIIAAKVLYANSRGLRGYFFWAISFDRNWEVSFQASQTMDSSAGSQPPELPPALPPSSSAPGKGSGFWILLSVLTSILLLVLAIAVEVKG